MLQAGLSIVAAEPGFGAQLATYLANQGLATALVADLAALLPELRRNPPRLVLLGEEQGVLLPALRSLREISRVPCIVLAQALDDTSQIVTLEAGADDYIDRNLPLRAILARVRALLRRSEWPPEMMAPVPGLQPPAAAAHGWRLQPQQRRLLRPDGSECELTTAEFDLMRLLVEANGVPVSRDDISATVFRRRFRAEDRTVDNLVLRLRRKLGGEQERSIKTVRGAGYMFAGFTDAELRVA
jgi:DNA-binding response OmpR family regulator